MNLINILKLAAFTVTPLFLFACDSQNSNRVSLGTANNSFTLGDLQYQEPFVVQVSDPNGNPSPNAYVSFKLRTLSYNKGYYVPVDIDSPPDGTDDRWSALYTITCPSEDVNGNGALDAGEDQNVNGVLDPAVPTITAYPDTDTEQQLATILPGTASLTTDANGFGYFSVTYPKSEALWNKIELIAEVQDGLPGNIASYIWTLSVQITDIEDLTASPPGGGNSPYGIIADCTNPD